MNVFDVHEKIVADYASYIRSFINIADPVIRGQSNNYLARSLSPTSYSSNPGFLGFVYRSGLPFRHHEQFRKEDLDARQKLYTKLAEEVWSPGRLQAIVDQAGK
jgi:hypothetical protein